MNKKLILPLVIGAGVIGLYFLIRKRNTTSSSATTQPQTGSQGTTTTPIKVFRSEVYENLPLDPKKPNWIFKK